MAAVVRSVTPLVMALLAASGAGAQAPTAPHPHPPLAELVKEYKRFGLPFPPPNAQLVRIEQYRYTWNPEAEADEYRYDLAYRVPPVGAGDRHRYLIVYHFGFGLEELEYVEPAAVEVIAPTAGALRSAYLSGGSYCLSLAVHCKDRGWDDLAAALYARARESFAADKDHVSVMSELRVIAWIFWRGPITQPGADRREAHRRLKALAVEDETFRAPEFGELLQSLELTIAPRTHKPGTIEALIDDLTEYWDDPYSLVPKPAESASYWKLAELGFDAVPALIEHLGDERLTRTWSLGGQWGTSYSLTVGHLCSRLLLNLSARTIGGRHWDAGGDRLDPAEARKWFERAKKVGEEKWLLEHAIPPFVGKGIEYHEGRSVVVGKGAVNHEDRAEPHIVRVIGAKYPARLPAVYRTMLKKSVEGGLLNDYVFEVVASKLSREQKIALLEEGIANDDYDHWVPALEGFARLDPALLRGHLRAALKRVWLRAWLGYPDPRDGARLVRLTEVADDRACWDALASATRAGGIEFRMGVISQISPPRPPDQADPQRLERVRFLVQFLDDRTTEIDEDGTRTEVRDYAASQLAGVLRFRVRRMSELYRPVYDNDRGPLSRLLVRAVVWQAAAQNLAAKK